MPQVDYISKDAAAKQLNLSVRRVQDLAKDGKIKSKLERNPETGHMTLMFHAGDVAAYQQRQEEASKLPAPRLKDGMIGVPFRQPFMPFVATTPPEPVFAVPQAWLTLDQAASYSGLPASFLRSLIDSGTLAAFDTGPRPGGRWRVAKRDLDTLQGERLTGQAREIQRMDDREVL